MDILDFDLLKCNGNKYISERSINFYNQFEIDDRKFKHFIKDLPLETPIILDQMHFE